MRKAVLVLGALAAVATGLWGLFASAFGSFPGAQLPRLLSWLLMVPLAVLPAAVLAGSRPRAAGIGLLGAAVASGALLLFTIHVTGRGMPSPAEWALALAVTCLPTALLGTGLLVSAKKTAAAPTSRIGLIYPSAHLLVTILVLTWAILATLQTASKLQWTLTVTPSGRAGHAIRLDARQPRLKLESEISEALDPIFTDPRRSGPFLLGQFEIAGFTGGREWRMGYEVRLEAEAGRVSILRSDLPEGMIYIKGYSFSGAKHMTVQHLEQVVAMNRLSPLR